VHDVGIRVYARHQSHAIQCVWNNRCRKTNKQTSAATLRLSVAITSSPKTLCTATHRSRKGAGRACCKQVHAPSLAAPLHSLYMQIDLAYSFAKKTQSDREENENIERISRSRVHQGCTLTGCATFNGALPALESTSPSVLLIEALALCCVLCGSFCSASSGLRNPSSPRALLESRQPMADGCHTLRIATAHAPMHALNAIDIPTSRGRGQPHASSNLVMKFFGKFALFQFSIFLSFNCNVIECTP
jgi:hypothetical protein